MSRRWAWWTACGLLLVVLLAFGAWRLSIEVPGRLRSAEETIRKDAATYGLRVSYRNLRLHLLYPRVSLEDLVVVDERPGIELLRAGDADAVRQVIVAAQRLSTLALADRAAVLFDGRVAEEGRPADLLERRALFADLFGDEIGVA